MRQNSSKSIQLKLGVVLSYISEGIAVLSSMIYTPFMIRLLGKSEYGIYQSAVSVVAYLGVLNLGFGSAYQRFYVKNRKESGEDGVAGLNAIYLLIFIALTALAVIAGIVILRFRNEIFGSKVSAEEIDKLASLLAVLIVNLAFTLITTVFTCYISAHEMFIFLRVIHIIKNIISPFVTIPLLFMGFGSIGVVCVTTILSALIMCIQIYYALRKLNMRFLFSGLHFGVVREMWGFTFFIFLNMIINQVNLELGKFILLRTAGAERVSEYSIGAQINTMYGMLSTSISSVFIPRVNKLVIERQDMTAVNALFIKVGRIQFLVLSLVLSGFVFFGKEFIRLWAGEGFDSSYAVALLLMAPITVPMIQNIGIEVQRAMNKHRMRSIVYSAIAVINISLTIPLASRYYGVGAAIGTAVSILLGNILFMNIYYHKTIGLNMRVFWRQIGSFFPAMLIPIAIGICEMVFLPEQGLMVLLAKITVYSLVFCISMYLFAMNNEEKGYIRRITMKLRKPFAGKR